MKRIATRIEIEAPQHLVWAKLAAVESWPSWLPTVSHVKPLGSPTLEMGARYEIRQPKLQPAIWLVTQLDPPQRFVWESRSPGMLVVADHVVSALPRANSQVELSITFSGILSPLVVWSFGALTEGYIRQEGEALKRVVEKVAMDNI